MYGYPMFDLVETINHVFIKNLIIKFPCNVTQNIASHWHKVDVNFNLRLTKFESSAAKLRNVCIYINTGVYV